MSSAKCRHRLCAALVAACLLGSHNYAAAGQTHLLGAGPTTRVLSISFAFDGPPPVETSALEELIATQAPGIRDRLPWPFTRGANVYLLDAVELQRDVVRIREHLKALGFLRAEADYAASVYDQEKDTIRIRFTVRSGAPIIIQDVGFFTADGYLAGAFEGALRDQWIRFRDRTSFSTGDRFTTFKVVQIEDAVLSWLKDQSFAFATLYTVTDIDSVYRTADISFLVDPGPPGTIADINIEGNRRVSQQLVQRELPFKVGEPFAGYRLVQGQRALFALNLFQVAQVRVPAQERDSSVSVSVELREARLRYIAAETGYDRRAGLWGEGRWSHRNFLGGARVFAATAELQTGLLASVPTQRRRLARASVAVTQPFVLTSGLAAVVEPFIQMEQDPLLLQTDQPFGINRREYGLNSTLLYGRQVTRSISLQYSLGRATAFSGARAQDVRDAYNKGVVTLGGSWGWTDNMLNPRRGYSVRSFAEYAGAGLEYQKVSVELAGFMPLTQDLFIGTHLDGGRVWPRHPRHVQLYANGTWREVDAQFAAPLENRFDPVRLYAGGSDVRGWSPGLAGPKVNRTAFLTDNTGAVLFDGERPLTTSEHYEPVGGLTRVVAGVELWYRLGGPWRIALFADAGRVSASAVDDEACAPTAYRDEDLAEPVEVQCGFADNGRIQWRDLLIGTGTGIRYETPIGYLRLDVAAKVNPDALDLQSPRNAFLVAEGLAEARRHQLNRLAVHISIGQAF